MCGRKSQPNKFQKVKTYTNDFESCFKIVKAIDEEEVICEGCRRAIEEHRRTGKSFHHVSAISSYYLTFEASLSCKRFKLFQKIKFNTRLCFCLKVCWHESQPARTITETQKSMSSKEMSDSGSTRDMLVIPQESVSEMEEKLRILSESK